VSDKVQAWVWDLDLQPARKLVLLWLAGRATDNGVAFPGEREIRERTGLGERMVRYHLQWLAGDRDEHGQPKQPLVVRVERRVSSQRNTSNVYILAVPGQQPDAVRRDLEELRHVTKHAIELALARVGATGCREGSGGSPLPPVGEAGCPDMGATGCREEPSRTNSHRNTPPLPPSRARQQQGLVVIDADQALEERDPDPDPDQAPQFLAEAFYRGLGGAAASVTPPLRRRDLAIARDLVAVGATPSEAEAYAREMSGKSMRVAPVDLRSFERERLGWQARCRGLKLEERRVVDRTGQPPSWQSEQPTNTVANAADFRRGVARSADGPAIAAHGEQLRQMLTSVLLRQHC